MCINMKKNYVWDPQKYADENGIPQVIELRTRRGAVETRLELAGLCFDEFNYIVRAEYPYSLIGEEITSYDAHIYQAIDFSEGPMLSRYENIPNTQLKIVEIAETEDQTDILIVVRKDAV